MVDKFVDLDRSFFDLDWYMRAAKKYAKSKGNLIDPDDFAQMACLRYLEDKPKIPKLKWVYADYCRKVLGRKGDKTNIHKTLPLIDNSKASIDPTQGNDLSFSQTLDKIKNIRPPKRETIEKKTHTIVIRELTQKAVLAKAAAALYYEWGFTATEIGKCFGMTQENVIYMLTEAKRFLKKELNKP